MRIRYLQCLLLFALMFLFIGPSYAAEFTVNPSLSLRGEYNDNIDFSRTNKRDDYIGTISPGLELGYGTDRINVKARAGVDFLRYHEYTDQNTERQNYTVDASYRAFERFTVNANGSYTKDTTLDSELQETGIVERRSERESYSAGGGISYRISEVSDLSINYTFSETDYDLDTYTDSEGHGVSLSYGYTFNNRLDTLSIRPYWNNTDSEDDKIDTYGLSLGLNHQFTPTFSTGINAGARYTETENNAGVTDDNWGWTADVSVTKTWQTASASLSYSHDLSYTAEGENVDVDRFSLDSHIMMTQKFGVRLSGSLYFTKSTGRITQDRDVRYYHISPSFFYNITQHHYLELAYSYANEFDKKLTDDRELDRNMVWLTLNFNFPRTW
ncbi:MAG: outer membrane beta-barrel protein [Deltaproteobacteria bacterium]|nr:outer membrane beta-barrel protein [Deltaproteobacteria bacterium]